MTFKDLKKRVTLETTTSQLAHRKGEGKEEGANGISSTDANVEEIGINDSDNNNDNSKSIDIKGAIALSATIISFLIALTLLESGGAAAASSTPISELQIPGLFGDEQNHR